MPDVVGTYTIIAGGQTYAPGDVVPIDTQEEAESLVARKLATWPAVVVHKATSVGTTEASVPARPPASVQAAAAQPQRSKKRG